MTGMHDMKYRQGGFTLVEMMVAMLLGIMILLAVSEVFVNNNRTRIEIENTTRQIENGRYAMQLLESELVNAGFFGEGRGVPFPTNPESIPACVGAADTSATPIESSMGMPIFGGDDSDSDCLARLKAGSNYVAVRRASTCSVGSAGCDAFRGGEYHLRVSACRTDTANPPPRIVLANPADLDSMPVVQTRRCIDLPGEPPRLAPTYRYLSRLFYVRDDDVLVRAELQRPGEGYQHTALVDGIERLHFEYGLDDNGDGEVDGFSNPSDPGWAVADWTNVVAVKIWLLARNLEPTPNYVDDRTYGLGPGGAYSADSDGFDPGFKRQLYVSTVRLNNLAGRREVPASTPAGEGETGGEDDGADDGAVE